MADLISRRTLLGAAFAAPIIGFGFAALSAEPATTQMLTASEALTAVNNDQLILVDVRQPTEWAQTGVAAGAYPIDMRRTDFIAEIHELRAANPDVPIAFICARGVRSHRVSSWAAAAGIENLVDIPEGMLGSASGPGWLARGLPVVTPVN